MIRHLAPLAVMAVLASGLPLHAQDASKSLPPNPPDVPAWEYEPGTADLSFQKDGFVLADQDDDHIGEKQRDVIAEHFVDPLGESVGRKPPLQFGYMLMDLTGSGFKSLVLWPRIVQLKPKNQDDGGVLRIYNFDGKNWHLALNDAAMVIGVRPHLDAGGPATGAMDLALANERTYRLFVYDQDRDEWTLTPR